MPNIYMIAGPNGAGKTTSAMDLLPEILECYEYVNADTIAAALSPFKPEDAALKAGRLMLDRIHKLAEEKKDFSFETTGASKSFAPFLKNCKELGYKVNVLFLWLPSIELALSRVATRVENGGHHIPDPIVQRRYHRGLINLFNLYIPLSDKWIVYDNSGASPSAIAQKSKNYDIIVKNEVAWQSILKEINK